MMDQVLKKQLDLFFDSSWAQKLEDVIESGQFFLSQEDIQFVNEILNIPIVAFVEYLSQNIKRKPIEAADVFQFSNFENATRNICYKLHKNNPGFNFIEIAKILLEDNVQRNDAALRKYGENHIKTAEAFGLAFKSSTKEYYLSVFGYAFCHLSEEEQDKLLLRLILRNKLISQLLSVALQGTFELETYLYDLSRSTYLRRKTNIRSVMKIMESSNEYDFSSITKNILY